MSEYTPWGLRCEYTEKTCDQRCLCTNCRVTRIIAELESQLAEARELLIVVDECDVDFIWASDDWKSRRDELLKAFTGWEE